MATPDDGSSLSASAQVIKLRGTCLEAADAGARFWTGTLASAFLPNATLKSVLTYVLKEL